MPSKKPPQQDELIREIVREAEAYLSAQVMLATSADQRASVMASVFAASGAALVAGLIAFAAGASAVSNSNAIFGGGIVASVLFLAGAGLCVLATLPVGFDVPGNEPDSWKEDIAAGTDILTALGETAGHYQAKISDNRTVLEANAQKFRYGALAGIVAPVAGFLVWFVMSFEI